LKKDLNALINDFSVLYKNGQYDRALEVLNEALKIAEKTFGPDDPKVATILHRLAVLYHTQRQYTKAEEACKRAIAISDKALGPDHPEVIVKLVFIADIYKSQGQHAQAEQV